MRGKNSESYTSRTIPVFSPFGGWRHHLAPVGSMSLDSRVATLPYESSSFATPAKAVGLWVLSNVDMSLQESIETYSAP